MRRWFLKANWIWQSLAGIEKYFKNKPRTGCLKKNGSLFFQMVPITLWGRNTHSALASHLPSPKRKMLWVWPRAFDGNDPFPCSSVSPCSSGGFCCSANTDGVAYGPPKSLRQQEAENKKCLNLTKDPNQFPSCHPHHVNQEVGPYVSRLVLVHLLVLGCKCVVWAPGCNLCLWFDWSFLASFLQNSEVHNVSMYRFNRLKLSS